VERTYLYRGRILNLALEGRYEIVEHKPAVAVIALKEGKMLFVRQMRPAVGLAPLEIPAGLIEPGEDPLEAARRELAEETGLKGDLTYLFSYYVSPASPTRRPTSSWRKTWKKPKPPPTRTRP